MAIKSRDVKKGGQLYWDEKFETMPPAEIQKFQLRKLKETVAWVYEHVPFYRRKLDEKGIKPNSIKSLEDLARLSFTVKNDLRDNYPFGLCAVPLTEVVRVHASSGTTGKPITGPYTADDRNQWTDCMARNMTAAGVRSNDIIQNAYGYGLFTGGLGFHQGATKIGARWFPPPPGRRNGRSPSCRISEHRSLLHSLLCPDHCRKGRPDGRGDEIPASSGGGLRGRTLDPGDAQGN